MCVTVAHSSSSDDTYNGWFIPKGTIVLGNQWWMLHDPKVYPNPEVFDPERFLGDTPQRDPTNIIFGTGRRSVFVSSS